MIYFSLEYETYRNTPYVFLVACKCPVDHVFLISEWQTLPQHVQGRLLQGEQLEATLKAEVVVAQANVTFHIRTILYQKSKNF